nr:hydrogenase small subunit [Frankia sp. Cj5]
MNSSCGTVGQGEAHGVSPPGGAARQRAADGSLSARLAEAGVARRSILKFCAGVVATLALPPQLAPQVAAALDRIDRPAVVWLEFQDCAGDSEAFLRSRNPSVADLILGMISLDYHETLMAAAGADAEDARDKAVARGGHLVVVEGSVPTGIPGSCTVGGRSAEEILRSAARGAAGIINVGTCSAFGGIPAAGPNPTGAVRVEDVVGGVEVVNLTGCPVNADNLTATIVHYLTFGQFPARDGFGRPLFAYGQRIHDTCARRGHFDAGQFAQSWGDDGHRRGWCLYRLGCKGPATFHNCPSVRYNGGTSWPVAAGHGCVGCSEPGFWDTMSPFYDRLPHVATRDFSLTADRIGLGVLAATATGFAAHGVGKVIQHRMAASHTTKDGQDAAGPAEPADDRGGQAT